MIRLAENIYCWNAFNEEKNVNFNGYLIACGDQTLVVDPPAHAVSDELFLEKKLGRTPTLAVVTNRHHLRDVQWWMERFAIPLAMHESETNDYEFEVARPLRAGERVAPGCTVVSLPGKTEGEIGLYLEANGGSLLVGDALIADPFGALRFVPEAKIQDRGRLIASLQALRGLSFQRLLPGDGEPLLTGAKETVVKYLDGVDAGG